MKAFDRITISGPEILDYPATHRILKNLGKYNLLPIGFDDSNIEVINSLEESYKLTYQAHKEKAPWNHPVALGKRVLHLTTQPGTFIKQCPGTNDMLCCQYHIINMVSNCPFDCSYCYLQTYLNQPMITFFVNEEDIFSQVRRLCENYEGSRKTLEDSLKTKVTGSNGLSRWPLRIGTGEISDSLALDPITEFSAGLVRVMSEFQNVRLELKTKSKNIEHLLSIPNKKQLIVSWSVNPAEIIEREEHGTARLNERIRAAHTLASAGFDIAFHFDPMIHTENWQKLYSETAELLLSSIPHKSIQWISIGGLRYLPQLKPIALKRHPDTEIFYDENVPGQDGKVRYLRPVRTEMFQFLNETIKSLAPSVYTYLCMETKPVWEKALGRMPERGF